MPSRRSVDRALGLVALVAFAFLLVLVVSAAPALLLSIVLAGLGAALVAWLMGRIGGILGRRPGTGEIGRLVPRPQIGSSPSRGRRSGRRCAAAAVETRVNRALQDHRHQVETGVKSVGFGYLGRKAQGASSKVISSLTELVDSKDRQFSADEVGSMVPLTFLALVGITRRPC